MIATYIKTLKEEVLKLEGIEIRFLTEDQIEKIKELRDTLNELGFIDVRTIFSEMGKELDTLNEKSKYLGKSWEENEAKINIFKNTLNRLLNVTPEVWNAMTVAMKLDWTNMVKSLIDDIGELEKTQDIVKQIMDGVAGLLSEFTNLSRNLIDRQLNDLKNRYDTEMALAANNIRKKTKLEEEYDKKRIALLRKQAALEKALGAFTVIINTAKGVMDAASKVATTPLIPWIIALGASQLAVIASQPLPMALGGIVPAGYPNDSYPALLSSGEMVIPPKKLPELEKDNNIHVIIEGKVKGQDIYYIMKEMERKHQNTY